MKQLIILLFLSLSGQSVLAQQRSLYDEIDSLATIIKDTYVGYKYKVKGNEFDALVKKVKQSPVKDTFARLSLLTTFFKDLHLDLFDYNVDKRKIDTPQCKRDSQMVRQYFANKKNKDPYEGYWRNDRNHCVMALIKVAANPVTYHGYIIESRAKAIPGYHLVTMVRQKDGTYLTDYTSANFGYRLFCMPSLKTTTRFGLTPLGANGCGNPIINRAYSKGSPFFRMKPLFRCSTTKPSCSK
jgi:hypothetical protein